MEFYPSISSRYHAFTTCPEARATYVFWACLSKLGSVILRSVLLSPKSGADLRTAKHSLHGETPRRRRAASGGRRARLPLLRMRSPLRFRRAGAAFSRLAHTFTHARTSPPPARPRSPARAYSRACSHAYTAYTCTITCGNALGGDCVRVYVCASVCARMHVCVCLRV